MDDLYDICDDRIFVESTTHGITGEVVVKKRVYYVVFDKGGKHYEGEILPVKTQVTKYIKDVAKWKLDEMLDKIAIEKV